MFNEMVDKIDQKYHQVIMKFDKHEYSEFSKQLFTIKMEKNTTIKQLMCVNEKNKI